MALFELNRILRFSRKSKLKLFKKGVNWFTRRCFACDIPCQTNIADSAYFEYGGIGTVVSPTAVIKENAIIQHRVTIGVKELNSNAATIHKNVFIGADAILIGDIEIGEGCIIGAGAVVTKDCKPRGIYVGNPARKLRDLS